MHRDVKPANILVTKDDVVKLSDFGIARAVSEHTLGVTQPGMVMGSVAYISPEQAQGHDIDERSDLYSVGVVLYQMLTGALPFTGDNPVAVALKHVSEEPKPIDPATTGVSPAVAAIVARLLSKTPQERYNSATELASALREAREKPHVVQGDDTLADAPTTRIAAVKPPIAPPPRRSVAPDRPAERAAATVDTIDTEYVAPGPDRRWFIFPALLALAIVAGFFMLRGGGIGNAQTIAVPNLVGKGATAAQQELLQRGLQSKVTNELSETVAQDHVIRQDPAPDTKLAKNEFVSLVVSGGLPRVQVPDVKGYSAGDAQRTLQNAKLRFKVDAGVQRHGARAAGDRRQPARRHVGAAELDRHADRFEGHAADHRAQRREPVRRRRAQEARGAGPQAERRAADRERHDPRRRHRVAGPRAAVDRGAELRRHGDRQHRPVVGRGSERRREGRGRRAGRAAAAPASTSRARTRSTRPTPPERSRSRQPDAGKKVEEGRVRHDLSSACRAASRTSPG